MVDKILVWISEDLFHFGISKFIKDNANVEIYAIIECYKKPKKFFMNQKLVNFKKIWFYYDNVFYSNSVPNMGYLTKFEDKYKINLWSVVYSERQFLEYNKYHKFEHNEILSIIEQECKFYEDVINEVNPDFFLVRLTDFQDIDLMYKLCKSKNIKILMLMAANIGFRFIVSENTKIDYIEKREIKEIEERNFEELKQYMNKFSPVKQTKKYIEKNNMTQKILKKKNLNSIFYFFFAFGKNNDRERVMDHGRTFSQILKNIIRNKINKKIRKSFLDQNAVKLLEYNEKFVYFALQVEPERSTLVLTPFYTNHLEMVRKISMSLPVDHVLYVKEHPIMETRGWRNISFYKEIMKIPNVLFLHPKVDPLELIKKSQLVISISGSAPIEAAFHQKPSIVFSNNAYSHLSFVNKISKLEELPEKIKESLEKKVDIKELNRYIEILNEDSFRFDLSSLTDEKHPFYGLIKQNIELKEQDVKNYLESHKEEYKEIAIGHIKKMNMHKKFHLE